MTIFESFLAQNEPKYGPKGRAKPSGTNHSAKLQSNFALICYIPLKRARYARERDPRARPKARASRQPPPFFDILAILARMIDAHC